MTRRNYTRHLVALGVFTMATLILTWPLILRITTHVPGDGIDNPALAWNLWWIKVRLVDQLNPQLFDADWMFHPIHVNLAFYTLTPLNGLISVPLQVALQLTLATNLTLISSFLLGAYGMFLLALTLQSKPPLRMAGTEEDDRSEGHIPTLVAISAGLIYAFASAKLFYAALGQFNIASSQWIPFAVLYMLRLLDSKSVRTAMRNGAMAGLFMVMQAWSELTYASFLLIFLAMVVFWWLYGRLRAHNRGAATSASWMSFGAGLVVAAIVFVVGLLPFLSAMVPDLRAEGDFFTSGGGFADVFSADLMGYLFPTILHPVFGGIAEHLPFPNDKGQHIYVGYVLLVLALLGVYAYGIRRRTKGANIVSFWAFNAVAFWLLTLGPYVRIGGHELPIPGPFALVSRLPFFSGNRYPSRYSVMLLLSVSSLAVYGLLAIVRYLSRRRRGAGRSQLPNAVVAGLALLILFEHLSIPLPLTDFRIPDIYTELAAEPGDFTILELPTGWRNGARVLGRSDVLIMMQQWYQTEHGKRRLGGNTSRNPALKFQYFTDAPVLGELIALMNADRDHIAAVVEPNYDALVARIREAAPDVLDFLGVKYVMLHVEKSPDLLVRAVEDALPVELVTTWTGPDWTGAPSAIRLYRVTDVATPHDWEIDLSTPAGRLYLAEGWSGLDGDGAPFRYATRPQSTLLLDIPDQGGKLQLERAGIATGIQLVLNDHTLETEPPDADNMVTVTIAPGIADQLVDRLTIQWQGSPVAIQDLALAFPGGNPSIENAFGLDREVTIGVRSAGEEVGDFAHIHVNGLDVAPNKRGYNLVALSPDGVVLDARAFDTHASPEASGEMAEWLGQWAQGTIIAGAVADEASYSLQDTAVDALQRLGVEEDLRGKFRWSHAFVAAVGEEQMPALEEASLIRPAGVSVGPPIDAPAATGGAGKVRFYVSD